MREFKAAAWPTALKAVSGIATLLICGITVAAIRAIPPVGGVTQQFGTAVACMPPAIIITALLFVVRSYRIEGGHLVIRRLCWTTTLPILGIHDACIDPEAVKGSLRIWGNGGLFGITGYYWNKRMGRYRIFATDPKKALVMRLHERIVVITPDDPEVFLQELFCLFPRLKNPKEPDTKNSASSS